MLLLLALAVVCAVIPHQTLGQVLEPITIAPLPVFSTCQPALISWSGNRPPYAVYIYPAGFTSQSDWIYRLPSTTRTQTIWDVNLAAGREIVVNVYAGISDTYAGPATIQDSGNSSCVIDGVNINPTSATPSQGSIPSPSPPALGNDDNSPDATTSTSSTASADTPGLTVIVVAPSGSGQRRSPTALPALLFFCVGISLIGLIVDQWL